MPTPTQIQIRRDTTLNWTLANPVLANGEFAVDTTTRLVRVGDGVTPWASLMPLGGQWTDNARLVPAGQGDTYVQPFVDLGTPTTDTLVAWTPLMSSARFWYTTEDALNIAGNVAAGGDAVWSIPNRIASVSRTDGLPMPLVPKAINMAAGIAANAPLKRSAQSVNGIFPVGFGAAVSGGLDDRLSTQLGAVSPTLPHTFVVVAAMRGTAFAHLLSVSGTAGSTMVSTNASRQLRAGTDVQIIGAFADSVVFMLTYQRKPTEDLFRNSLAAASCFGAFNGAQNPGNATGGASTANANVALQVGNRYDTDGGADMDLFEIIGFEGSTVGAPEFEVRASQGYLAAKYSTALAALMPGDHLFRSGPPMVPVGSTTPQFSVITNPWGYRQVCKGYLFEIADGNIGANDGAQGTDASRRTLYDLLPSERRRLALMLRGAYAARMSLGIFWRGQTSFDAGTGLYKGVGPEYTQQRRFWYEFLRDAGCAGAMPEYWTPGSYWKTNGVQGTLWAGGANARGVTLDSIRGSDPSGYAAQIAAFTTQVVLDLEDIHSHDTYPIRVVGFGLQNEPLGADASYGACSYTPTLYLDVMKSLIPKIRASTKLSAWGNGPNTVAIHADSWGGPWDTICTAIVADATVLSTGKTVVQELAAWSTHNIGAINADPNVMLTGNGTSSDATGKEYYAQRITATNPTGISVFANEYERFDTPASRDIQFAQFVLPAMNFIGWTLSPHAMLIHIAKAISDSTTLRYALAAYHVPGDTGADVTGYAAGLDYGKFATIDCNLNAMLPFIRRLKGAQVLLTQEATYSATKRVVSLYDAYGKLTLFVLNAGAAASAFTINLGAVVRTMRGYQYSSTQRDVLVGGGATVSTQISTTVPAYTHQVWVEA